MGVRLLGSFSVSVGGEVVAADAWRLRKARDVIKLLALASRHRLHRDQLIDLLWPDLDQRSGANNLYQTLSAARGAIASAGGDGHACLRLEDGWVSLCPTERLWVDVEAFEERSGSDDVDDLLEAVSVHRGELLADDRYVDWAAPRREAVRQRYRAVLLALGRHYERAGDLREAQAHLDRLIADEPTHEAAHQALMRVHARAGDRAAAVRQYGVLEEALRAAIGVEPSTASRALVDHVRGGLLGPDPPTEPATNLPSPLSTFIGRDHELTVVPSLVRRNRLITLTGPGGCGKTRLATEVARRCLHEFDEGVFLVELDRLTSSPLVELELARTLDVRAEEGASVVDAVARRIGVGRMLLVLDNCEHLVGAVTAAAETLLTACPQLVVLATSREPLRLTGELVQRVPSLGLPDLRRTAIPSELERYDAVRLLVDRIRAVDPSFSLSGSNAAAVAAVCCRLDGLPLALELAAARVPALTVTGVAARLDDRFRLLTGGRRTALTRHRTLQGTVEWSFDLLTKEQQQLFCRLAVFRGPFDVEAAESVAEGDDGDVDGVASTLGDLVDRSMVVAEARGEHARFRLLETLRAYGMARLRATDLVDDARSRHARWFVSLVDEAAAGLSGPDRHRWLERLHSFREDLRAAAEHLLATDPSEALRMARSLWPYWLWFGYLRDGLDQLEAVLATRTGPTEERSECWLGAFAIHTRWSGIGQPGMHAYVANALAEAQEADSVRAESRALVFDGIHRYVMDVDDLDRADERFQRAREIARAGHHPSEEASALHARGVLAWYRLELDLSRELLHEALDLVRGHPEPRGSLLMFAVGPVVSSLRLGERRLVWEETLMPYTDTCGRCAEAYVLANVGSLERVAGRVDEAHARLEDALAIYRLEGDMAGQALVQARLGRLALSQGEPVDAERRLDLARAIHRRIGDARSLHQVTLSLVRVAIESGRLHHARRLLSDAMRTMWQRGDRPANIAALEVRGVLELAEGDPQAAIGTLSAALALQETIGHHLCLAVSSLDLADAHVRAGDSGAAAAPASDALAVFETLGYLDAADRCRRVLAAR